MKCENCGAEYGARELKCPYCGTKNLTGAQWQQEEEHAQQRMRQEKSWAIRKAPIYVVNRVANVILLVSLALFVLSIDFPSFLPCLDVYVPPCFFVVLRFDFYNVEIRELFLKIFFPGIR